MTRQRGTILFRLVLVIALGIIFLAGGLLVARHFFRPDVRLEQEIRFRPRADLQDELANWWPEFAARQEAELRQIAWRRVPGLAEYLDVDVARRMPTLTVSVRGPYHIWPGAVERFDTLLASYVLAQEAQAEARATIEREGLFQFTRTFPLSRGQLIVIVVFGLAGLLLGWALPEPGRRSRPAPLPSSPGEYRNREAGKHAAVADEYLADREVPGLTGPAGMEERPARRSDEGADQRSEPSAVATGIGAGVSAEAVPVVRIDLEKDQPGAAGAAGRGWQPKYDELASSVECLETSVRPVRVLVAATEESEASPRFTVNLAIALVRSGRRVLLVEADPNSHELAELFDIGEGPGFYDWLAGLTPVGEAVHSTSLAGLSVMSAGLPSPEPTSGTDLPFEDLAGRFDVVIFYAPGALASQPGAPLAQLTRQVHAGLALTRRRRAIIPLQGVLAARMHEASARPLAVVSLGP